MLRIDRLTDAMVMVIRECADELTALDQAVGDADHGINMKRGFDAVAAVQQQWADLPLGEALYQLGMTLVMKVGGAAGPLYGSLFMEIGKTLAVQPTIADLSEAMSAGVEAVKRRGKSEAGEKTMLDVLVPANQILRAGADDGTAAPSLAADIVAAARGGLEATRDMQATKGRASFLKERSVGHLDPGAMSSYLLIKTTCELLEDYS